MKDDFQKYNRGDKLPEGIMPSGKLIKGIDIYDIDGYRYYADGLSKEVLDFHRLR